MSEPLSISMYRKRTHADRYLQFYSAHPTDLKRTITRGLVLRANRLLKCFPMERHAELNHLRTALCNSNNKYPPKLLAKWFREFNLKIQLRPEILRVRSHLDPATLLDGNGFQKFDQPTAIQRFPDNNLSVLSVSEEFETVEEIENREPDGEFEEANPQVQQDTRPVMILPFVRGVSDKLHKLASEAGVCTWFSYPG